MKVAYCKYNQAGTELTLNLCFDNKAFEFIRPALTPADEEELIRTIGDSLAAISPKETRDRWFYVKRALRKQDTLTLFCTDCLLIDSQLTLTVSQQAFAKERIKITDSEQLPSRIKLSNELLKQISERLIGFDEQARKEMPAEKQEEVKETQKQDETIQTTRAFESDKAIEVLAEIGNVKKEVKEMAETSVKNLKSLMEQIEQTHQRIFKEVMKETESSLKYEDNKTKLNEFANNMIAQFGGGGVEKSKAMLNQKATEIQPISQKFEAEIEESTKRITRQTDILALFKKHLITALYDAGKAHAAQITPKLETALPNAKKTMLIDFNKKFANIATLSDTGKLSSLDAALDKLTPLTFENLQEIISSEEKDSPGLLQKCNTSWTEESPELQLVMQHLGKLNPVLSALFENDPEFKDYAKMNMIEIIRIPFPRSFQFKFSDHAMNYKRSVDEFCKTQKDNISNLSNQYKRTIQIDNERDKAKRAITDIQKQIEAMKKPVAEFRDLLLRKEKSGDLIASANKDHDLILQAQNAAKQWEQTLNTRIDASLKVLRNKISSLVEDSLAHTQEAEGYYQSMVKSKSELDLAINQFSTRVGEKITTGDLDEKIRTMETNQKLMSDQFNLIRDINSKLAIYEPAFALSEKMALAIAQSNMRKQQTEAKSLLLQLIKNPNLDDATAASFKKKMVDMYTLVDTNVANIDKIIHELTATKQALFNDLNSKTDVPVGEMQAKVKTIEENLNALETTKETIAENLSALRKLSLEAVMERK